MADWTLILSLFIVSMCKIAEVVGLLNKNPSFQTATNKNKFLIYIHWIVQNKRFTPRFVDEIYFCVPSLTTQKGSQIAASLGGMRFLPESKVILIRCMTIYSGATNCLKRASPYFKLLNFNETIIQLNEIIYEWLNRKCKTIDIAFNINWHWVLSPNDPIVWLSLYTKKDAIGKIPIYLSRLEEVGLIVSCR